MTAVIALLVITAMVYHLWSQKKELLVLNPQEAVKAKSIISTQSKTSIAQQAENSSNLQPAVFKRAPISDRIGNSQQSNDLIVAMMEHQELALTPEEMEKLLTAYIEVSMERSTYEASIATVKVIDSNSRLITIAPYSQEGGKLQAELYQKFSQFLGVTRAAQIKEALAPTLYARNYGFGDVEQEIKVTLLEGEPIRYSFVHSAGTLKIPYQGSFVTVNYGGLSSTLMLTDLSNYSGLIHLLPGGGS